MRLINNGAFGLIGGSTSVFRSPFWC